MAENERNTWVKVLIVLLIVVIGFAVLGSTFGSGMMGGMMGFGGFFLLLPVILIIVLVYTLLDEDTHKYSQPPYNGGESPMDVLERKYANGEIGREEYIRIKKDMRK